MKRALIIADDFTGANDTGVQLTKRGMETYVVLDGENIKKDNISYVLDTESRILGSEEAYERLKKQLKGIFTKGFDLVYKKIDSTLRGNIVSELKAMDEEYKADLIIFAPAFPDIGRVTKDGIHFVNETRITNTEFSRDPQNPVIEDNIQKILQLGFSESVTHHSLEKIRKDNIKLSKGRIHTFDATNNQDLNKIATVAINTGKKVLWVGSAALANVILNIYKPFKPALGVVGSLSEVSRKQMRYAEKKGIKILEISISDILNGASIEDYINNAVELLVNNNDLILTSSYYSESYRKTMKMGDTLSLNKEEISSLVSEILGKISKEIIKRVQVAGLFITGGDTAMGFIKSTKAIGSHIVEEIMTGIPLMELNGGDFHGLKVVTKAGAFGNKEALYYSMGKIKEDI